ncbi:hypothetical protein AADG42_08955 [Ammonicoccus fulvus]|uniref:DUF2567 domain-containing protein n=1 Tax=Ammonicoccus fulvus TaxID=3138240 RepID=A0ABZ3FRQ0_9ACTN
MSERLNGFSPGEEPEGEPLLEGLTVAPPPSVQHDGDAVTTGTIPVVADPKPSRRPVRTPLARWLLIMAAICVAVGALAGAVWALVVPLTLYRVQDDGRATTTERGLAGYIAGDAWFVVIGVVLGVAIGLWCWRWFGGLGWPAAVIAVLASTATGLVCWWVGWMIGPGPIEARLALAEAGQELPIELTVRGHAAVLAWPFAALLVLMLISAVSPDPEETRRVTRDKGVS